MDTNFKFTLLLRKAGIMVRTEVIVWLGKWQETKLRSSYVRLKRD